MYKKRVFPLGAYKIYMKCVQLKLNCVARETIVAISDGRILSIYA